MPWHAQRTQHIVFSMRHVNAAACYACFPGPSMHNMHNMHSMGSAPSASSSAAMCSAAADSSSSPSPCWMHRRKACGREGGKRNTGQACARREPLPWLPNSSWRLCALQALAEAAQGGGRRDATAAGQAQAERISMVVHVMHKPAGGGAPNPYLPGLVSVKRGVIHPAMKKTN